MEQTQMPEIKNEFKHASHDKRMINYLIDFIFIYILISIIFAFIAPDLLEPDAQGEIQTKRIFRLALYAVILGVIEVSFNGKSLGKLITKTRAVQLDGEKISIKTAILRGLIRAIPFVGFSAFGKECNPWHDKWTKSIVIDESKKSSSSN
jgi:hypothetical protein